MSTERNDMACTEHDERAVCAVRVTTDVPCTVDGASGVCLAIDRPFYAAFVEGRCTQGGRTSTRGDCFRFPPLASTKLRYFASVYGLVIYNTSEVASSQDDTTYPSTDVGTYMLPFTHERSFVLARENSSTMIFGTPTSRYRVLLARHTARPPSPPAPPPRTGVDAAAVWLAFVSPLAMVALALALCVWSLHIRDGDSSRAARRVDDCAKEELDGPLPDTSRCAS